MNNGIDKTRFSAAMQQFLAQVRVGGDLTEQRLFDTIEAMSKAQKRGIWQFVGQALDVTADAAKNFYHNTWSRQFYQKLSCASKSLQEIMEEMKGAENKKIIDEYLRQNQGSYSRRQISQQMYKIRKQAERRESEGFSVSNHECDALLELFSDICLS